MNKKQHIWLPYTQMQQAPKQLQVKKTRGSKIFLQDGTVLIDGIASWWSVAHGYNHPHICKKIRKQLSLFPHIMMAGLKSQETYRLAERLSKITPKNLNKVFFSDSGSTAIEVAMKMAIQFYINKKQPAKTKFISFTNAYNGDTTGSMSLADLSSGMHQKFKRSLLKNYCIKLPKNENQLNEFESIIIKLKDQIAGIFIEPLVQCAGGMIFHQTKILQHIFQISKKHDLLFIADECAVGFWRTGLPFACNHANISPDIMVLGKALTGGFMTLAATVASDIIYEAFLGDNLDMALMHGPTFMGNPLACAAANASLDLFEKEDYTQKVINISNLMNQHLSNIKNKHIIDIRILGAIGVIETDLSIEEIFQLRKEFTKYNVWLRPFVNVIYIMPALNIAKKELLFILKKISDVINNLK